MKSIIITPKDPYELKFISELLKKLGISSQVLSQEEMEDIGLSVLMREANREEKVSREEIFNKLGS